MAKDISKQNKKTEYAVKRFVKVRDNFTCQMCDKEGLEGSNCHASHVRPVSSGNQFRFDPLNMKTLCYHCHMNIWHKDPNRASEWFKSKFPERYEYLYKEPAKTVKFSLDELKEIEEKYNMMANELLEQINGC